MAKKINFPFDKLNKSNVEKITINEFTLLGYRLLSDIVDFYYLFASDDNNVYLIKNSFLLNEDKEMKDLDLKYFNSSLHLSQNLNLDVAMEKNEIIKRKMQDNFTRLSDSTYQMDFSLNEIEFKYVYSYGLKIKKYSDNSIIKNGINKDTEIINFKIPMNIYLKLALIRNCVLFKYPIYTAIEQDTRLDNYILHDMCNLKYLGANEVNKDTLMSYYSLSIGNKLLGLAQINQNIKSGIITKNMTNEQFVGLFGKDGFFLVDPTKAILLDWKIDKDIKPRIGLIRPTKDNKNMNVYIIDQDIDKSSILNPYKEIFNK